MEKWYRENKSFEKIDFSTNQIEGGEYESCSFISCNFSDADLSDIVFTECTFESCNLSMAKLVKTAFRDVRFTNCKMLGLQFENCNKLGLSFTTDNCKLNHSTFFQVKLIKTLFRSTDLTEADFTEADFSNSTFENCNFFLAVFEKTSIVKSDFRTSFNYSIDPEKNNIRKAKFSIEGVKGLLEKYDLEIE